MSDENDVVISVDNVSKVFRLPHERQSTIKSMFTNVFKGTGSKYYEPQQALKDISFEVKKGEFFGIVGRNGSGKSTLLKILAEIYQPTSGSIETKGKLVPFIELGVGFNPELTGRENVYLNGAMLGFSKEEVEQRYGKIVEFAELEQHMDQKLKNYSSGMQVRLAFSVAIQADADILLIDEVLAVGDADFQKKCYDYFYLLKKQNKTVVFVSHDMGAIRSYCDEVVLIEQSELQQQGKPRDISQLYSKMFLKEDTPQQVAEQTPGRKWGNGVINIQSVSLASDSFSTLSEQTVGVSLKAVEKVNDMVVGVAVKNKSGDAFYGLNTAEKNISISNCRSGEELTVKFTFPLNLSNGNYTVDVACHGLDVGNVYEWWNDAAHFSVNVPENNSSYNLSAKNAKVSVAKNKK